MKIEIAAFSVDSVPKRVINNVAVFEISFSDVRVEPVNLVCAVQDRGGLMYCTVFSPLE